MQVMAGKPQPLVEGCFLNPHRVELTVAHDGVTQAISRDCLIASHSGVAVLPIDMRKKLAVVIREPLPGPAVDGIPSFRW